MPIISIIIPVYNVEKYLDRCINSVLSQTFTDFECILIDDGSPDNSGKICDEYAKKDERIKIVHQKNGGVSAARNAGLGIVQGEWIGFVDSDDWCEPDMFGVLYENAMRYNADISVCDCRIRASNEISVDKITKGETYIFRRDEAKMKIFTTGTFGNNCAKIIKSSLCLSNKITYNNIVKYMEDTLFNYEVFGYADIVVYSPVPLYNYFANPESVTKQLGLTQAAKTAFIAIDKMISMEENNKIKNKIIVKKILFAIMLCCHHIMQGDYTSEDFQFLRNILCQYKKQICIDFSISLYQKIKMLLLIFFPPFLYCRVSKIWRKLSFRRKETK